MAARNGHLELCRFLLRETSLSADNLVLSSALKEVQEHAWSVSRKIDDALLEAFYSLLVSEHNMEIDLLDPPTSLDDVHQLTHTETSFGVVLASQPTPFADLSLAQKFSATIKAVGWPADAFSTMLHSHDPTEVVTRTTEEGMTALHWAAAHLGEWPRLVEDIYASPYFLRRVGGYAKLASDLVRMGADIHALRHEKMAWPDGTRSLRKYDPFLSLFRGVDLKSKYYWSRSSMAQAVRIWGQVLVEGGVDLHEYIVTENEFLTSTEWANMNILSSGMYDGCRASAKLFITGDSTLAVTVREIPSVTVWKAQATRVHVPGAWPASPLLVDTIIWMPGAMDECHGFDWAASYTVNVTNLGLDQIEAPGMSSGSDELPYDSIIDAARGPWEATVSQDDHGPVAIILGRETRSRQRVSGRHSGRRAPSAPPLQDRRPISGADWTNKAVCTPSGWRFTLHKCPSDSRWHQRVAGIDLSYFRRDCMQGRCHEVRDPFGKDDAATFERWLLRNEEHVHVAKRYAQKFCPEQMHVVEETLVRATDRARLAMGPKRPEATGVRQDATVYTVCMQTIKAFMIFTLATA
jgi:hypothetical protein